MGKRTFLAVYDYGMGGVWVLIDAVTKEQIEDRFPDLKAYDDRPTWMTDATKDEYISDCIKTGFHWDINAPATGWLANLKDTKK